MIFFNIIFFILSLFSVNSLMCIIHIIHIFFVCCQFFTIDSLFDKILEKAESFIRKRAELSLIQPDKKNIEKND
ncbi:hypothetical protein [Fusobacterium perfoetens]|uniref:hypothetical protein n=1 Tax=Fusobacterium perfoetens TaxID=852 RepID=UPI0026E9FF5E|nr:hypothetical protein [Fusobacterium perfoetens]